MSPYEHGDEEADRIRRWKPPARFVVDDALRADPIADPLTVVQQALREAAQRMAANLEQQLAALLFEAPTGTRLCVHEPEYLAACDDPYDDTRGVHARQRMHQLADGETCGAAVRRTEYLVPIREAL